MDYKELDFRIREAIARMEAQWLESETITGYGYGKDIIVTIKNKYTKYPENAEPIKDNVFNSSKIELYKL